MPRGCCTGHLETESVESAQQVTAQNAASPRLIDTDFGWAYRHLPGFQSLEFRIGYDLTADVRTQDLVSRDTERSPSTMLRRLPARGRPETWL
jgi:hypothetical protein